MPKAESACQLSREHELARLSHMPFQVCRPRHSCTRPAHQPLWASLPLAGELTFAWLELSTPARQPPTPPRFLVNRPAAKSDALFLYLCAECFRTRSGTDRAIACRRASPWRGRTDSLRASGTCHFCGFRLLTHTNLSAIVQSQVRTAPSPGLAASAVFLGHLQ